MTRIRRYSTCYEVTEYPLTLMSRILFHFKEIVIVSSKSIVLDTPCAGLITTLCLGQTRAARHPHAVTS